MSQTWSDVAEALLPWGFTPGGLNDGEEGELARFRANGPPHLAGVKQAKVATSTLNKGAPMAGQAIVKGATKALELVRKNPRAVQKLNEYYSKATGKVVDFTNAASSAVATRGPAPSAVVLRGVVSAGINPDDIFEADVLVGQRDAATNKIISDLRTVYAGIAGRLDSAAVIKSNGGLAERLFNKEVITFARTVYGSPAAIREAHAKMRAFLAMDREVLEETIALHLGR